jgi:uncharacterized protein involved in exopolysaccharide biosynthesis
VTGPRGALSAAQATDFSLAGLARVLLSRRRLIIGLALAMGFITGVRGLLTARTWTSGATFMPQTRRTPAAGLSGLAAQLGISVPTLDAGQGPAFYADFVTSRTMFGALADTSFEMPSDTGPARVRLVDVYRAGGNTPERRRDGLIRKLGSRITAVAMLKTGVVRVRVTAPNPELARQMTSFILDGLNRFNLVTRQSQAGAERRFMEGRLDEARSELRGAEDRLQGFMQRNREYRNSPELTFQQERLSREVQMRQQVYTSLAQAYEQAKIEEVRDTPVITVVEAPEAPVRPDRRGALRGSIVALFSGALIGSLLAVILAALERERAGNAGEMLAVETELRALRGELRRPWLLLRRGTR